MRFSEWGNFFFIGKNEVWIRSSHADIPNLWQYLSRVHQQKNFVIFSLVNLIQVRKTVADVNEFICALGISLSFQ